jgi:hypothetical protein
MGRSASSRLVNELTPGYVIVGVTLKEVHARRDGKMARSFAALALVFGSVLASDVVAQQPQAPPTRLTVLVTASSETDSATSAAGAATKVGGVVVGGAGANTSTYEHSEVWEVVRRFSEECSAASFVTNPLTPHTLTIHADYQKVSGVLMAGTVLYQLVLLDGAGNPLYVSKKNWLYREIKPICKVIQKQTQ